MNPTPEQVAQWTREAEASAKFQAFRYVQGVVSRTRDEWLCFLAFTEGRIHQAEQDAKLCENRIANATDWDSSYWDQACNNVAHSIRASAPKGTM